MLSTTDVATRLERYRAIGCDVNQHDETYGFASLGPVEFHVALDLAHDTLRSGNLVQPRSVFMVHRREGVADTLAPLVLLGCVLGI